MQWIFISQIILAATLLTGCATTYYEPTEAEYLEEARSLSSFDLCYVAIHDNLWKEGITEHNWTSETGQSAYVEPIKRRSAAYQVISEKAIKCDYKLLSDFHTYRTTAELQRLSNSQSTYPGTGMRTAPASNSYEYENGTKVYSADECIGPIIMGECHGSILPNKAYSPTCHGQMLNGQCTGPMF